MKTSKQVAAKQNGVSPNKKKRQTNEIQIYTVYMYTKDIRKQCATTTVMRLSESAMTRLSASPVTRLSVSPLTQLTRLSASPVFKLYKTNTNNKKDFKKTSTKIIHFLKPCRNWRKKKVNR